VKELASDSLEKGQELAKDGLEKGQELAKGQQLKLELKKLEAALDDAHAAYGRKAFHHAGAGTLSADALTTEGQAVRDAQAAVDAKKAEIDALAETTEDGAAPAEATDPVAAGESTGTASTGTASTGTASTGTTGTGTTGTGA
jgi:hypothetical protein